MTTASNDNVDLTAPDHNDPIGRLVSARRTNMLAATIASEHDTLMPQYSTQTPPTTGVIRPAYTAHARVNPGSLDTIPIASRPFRFSAIHF